MEFFMFKRSQRVQRGGLHLVKWHGKWNVVCVRKIRNLVHRRCYIFVWVEQLGAKWSRFWKLRTHRKFLTHYIALHARLRSIEFTTLPWTNFCLPFNYRIFFLNKYHSIKWIMVCQIGNDQNYQKKNLSICTWLGVGMWTLRITFFGEWNFTYRHLVM